MATSTSKDPVFDSANPHALAVILDASETREIIAARDIFDIAGIKLWARDQPVSRDLQRKLMDRRLRDPLETSLVAADGLTLASLAQALEQRLADESHLFAPLWRAHAARLLREVPNLTLHPVAQLLLTASQTARPEAWSHALDAMALAGTLALEQRSDPAGLKLALTAGLLHDLGEMYIDPRYGEADADRELDALSYQQLVVHPHVGHLVIGQLTTYPPSIARAVAEHHEHMDGSGYPHRLGRDAISPLGRMLAVVEAALGVGRRGEPVDLARVSVALRVVPSEHDLPWVGAIATMARRAASPVPRRDLAHVQGNLVQLRCALEALPARINALAMQPGASPALRSAVQLVAHTAGRLRAGWYETGAWAAAPATPAEVAEAEAIGDELIYRLRGAERAARLQASQLPPAEAQQLDQFFVELRDSLR